MVEAIAGRCQLGGRRSAGGQTSGEQRRPGPGGRPGSSGTSASRGAAASAALTHPRRPPGRGRRSRGPAARGRPGPTQRGGTPAGACDRRCGAQVHQPVGDLRPPPGDVEPRQRRAAVSSSAAAQPTVGLAHVGQLATLGRGAPSRSTAAPTRYGHQARPRRRPPTTASPASSAAAVEAPRAAEARPGRPRPGRPRRSRWRPRRAAGPARPPGSPPAVDRRQAERAQPGHGVGGVVADHGVEQQVGDHVAAQPRGAPPGQAGRGRQQGAGSGRHGRRCYARPPRRGAWIG